MQEEPTLPLNQDQAIPLKSSAASESGSQPAAWGGFHLLARVGAGGFGEVYRAWDPSLQREVALKLLLPGTSGSSAGSTRRNEDYEATIREARALASVKHPNIVSIYGVDRHDGRVGFWTDFVRGKTLRAIVTEQGPFGYREAAIIGLDVARALSAVHRAGLLHRDIKPENVMREEGGRILLMDFGLSILPDRNSNLAGTPQYMAPELFAGAPASVAADLYAVGILLYFLVTASHPVRLTGLSVAEAAEASKQRKPLIDQRSDLPEAFLRVVNVAIDLDPAKRFPSAGAMAEALADCIGASSGSLPSPLATAPQRKSYRWHLSSVGALVLLGAGAYFLRHAPASPPSPRPPAEAAASSPGSYDQYLKAEALLDKSYKASNLAAALTLFHQLTESDPGFAPGWAGLGYAQYLEYYDRPDPKLLDQATTNSQHAIDLDRTSATPYVTLARLAAKAGNNSLAMDMARTALNIDPTNSEAFRAEAAVFQAENKTDQAIAAVQQAIALNPDDWRGPMALGQYLLDQGKLQEAAEQFQRSADKAQDNRNAYYNLGIVDMRLNKLEDARANIARALEIEPDADTYQELAWLFIAEGKFEDAVAQDQKAVDLDPSSYNAWANLGAARLHLPNGVQLAAEPYRKAAQLAEVQRRREPRNPELLASIAYYYVRSGDRERGATYLRQALALSPGNPKIEYVAGEAYEILGDRAKAIDLITRSVGPGYSPAEIDRDPDLVELRKDPAFQARLQAILATGKK